MKKGKFAILANTKILTLLFELNALACAELKTKAGDRIN